MYIHAPDWEPKKPNSTNNTLSFIEGYHSYLSRKEKFNAYQPINIYNTIIKNLQTESREIVQN